MDDLLFPDLGVVGVVGVVRVVRVLQRWGSPRKKWL